MRQAPGKERQLDVDLSPLAIIFRVVRTVGEDVLVAKLQPDVLGDGWEFVGIVEEVSLSAGHFGDFIEKPRTQELFQGGEFPVEDTN